MSSYYDQWNSSIRPSHLTDQRFGIALDSGEVVSQIILPLNAVVVGKGVVSNYTRSLRSQSGRSDRGSTVIAKKNKYEISLDVQQFEQNEITVKVNANNILIEGNHEEKHDRHGSVSRQFVRKYWVPNDYNLNKVSSSLSSDGVLTVSVQRVDDANEDRVIPILQVRALDERSEDENEDDHKSDDEKRQEKCVKKVAWEGKRDDKREEKRDDKQEGKRDDKRADKRDDKREDKREDKRDDKRAEKREDKRAEKREEKREDKEDKKEEQQDEKQENKREEAKEENEKKD